MRTSIIVFILIFLIGCKIESRKPVVVQVYYRDLFPYIYSGYKTSGLDTIRMKTEVLFLYSDNFGLQFKDDRNVSEIDNILSDIQTRSKEYPNVSFQANDFAVKLQKIKIDSNNFVLKMIPSIYGDEFIYKCNFNPVKKQMDTRHFLIQQGDTNMLTYSARDSIGIYTYKIISEHEKISTIKYPSTNIHGSRNIVTQKLGNRPKLRSK